MATNGVNGHTIGVNGTKKNALCSVDELVAQTYDYVVVGGGTAGLCVAARLTEDPNITVAVLEAGQDRMNDKSVSTPGLYPTLIGRKEYDWCMTSVEQPTAGNKMYSMPRGKLLGGSSGINYLMYVRGSKGDYNGWESLGNPGWNWDGLAPYFRKHQTLDKTKSKASKPQFTPAAGGDEFHGNDGPIHTSFNDWYSPFEEDFVEAAYEATGGERTLHDAWSGDHMGFYSSLAAVNRTNDPGNRSYAATGYLKPNLGRTNLKVLTEAQATKILGIENKQADGVEFVHGGKKYTVSAKKEVVLSAGVIQTPQLLELSGIGDPEVLSKVGINCIVESPGVGAHFQDHVLGGLLFDLKPGVASLDDLHGADFAKASQELYDKTHQGPFGSPGMMMGFVSYANLVGKEKLQETIKEIAEHSQAKTKFEKAQEKVITDQLTDPTFANLQTFCIMCRLDVGEGSDQTKFFSKPPEVSGRNSVTYFTADLTYRA